MLREEYAGGNSYRGITTMENKFLRERVAKTAIALTGIAQIIDNIDLNLYSEEMRYVIRRMVEAEAEEAYEIASEMETLGSGSWDPVASSPFDNSLIHVEGKRYEETNLSI